VICCYASTEERDDEKKNAFYDDLELLYDSLPRNSVKIIIRDLNAQIGRESHYKPTIGQNSLHLLSNDNGMRIINFATSKDLTVSSTHSPR